MAKSIKQKRWVAIIVFGGFILVGAVIIVLIGLRGDPPNKFHPERHDFTATTSKGGSLKMNIKEMITLAGVVCAGLAVTALSLYKGYNIKIYNDHVEFTKK